MTEVLLKTEKKQLYKLSPEHKKTIQDKSQAMGNSILFLFLFCFCFESCVNTVCFYQR